MPLKVYARPTGTTITVNDNEYTRKHAEEQGWVEHIPEKPKRTRKKKTEKVVDDTDDFGPEAA